MSRSHNKFVAVPPASWAKRYGPKPTVGARRARREAERKNR